MAAAAFGTVPTVGEVVGRIAVETAGLMIQAFAYENPRSWAMRILIEDAETENPLSDSGTHGYGAGGGRLSTKVLGDGDLADVDCWLDFSVGADVSLSAESVPQEIGRWTGTGTEWTYALVLCLGTT